MAAAVRATTAAASRRERRGRDRDAGFDDARFVRGDLGEGGPEHPRVLVVERRDRRDGRVDDVGGVQEATQADFDHGHVARGGGEVVQGHRRRQLERRHLALVGCGRFQLPGGRECPVGGSGKGIGRDVDAVDRDPLPERVEVG